MNRFTMTWATAGLFSLLLGNIAVKTAVAQTPLANPNSLDRPDPPLSQPATGRLYPGGRIDTPSSSMQPSVTVPYSNGRTTYYYPDGTSITVEQEDVSPYGTFVRPGAYNGGLREDQYDSRF